MAAPTVTAVNPTNSQIDVVLGTSIVVTFSTLMDHTSITNATFSLTGPGQTMIVTPDQYISSDPISVTGREYITGTFAFDDTNGWTILTFTPSEPLRPNVSYTLLLLGNDGVLTSASIKDSTEVPMTVSYTWSFTTGNLNVTFPPPQSPVPGAAPQIDPTQIMVIPRMTGNQVVGTDLTQEIDIIFPGVLDPNSFDMNDILMSVEPILGDPSVPPPIGLTTTAVVVGNKIKITISGFQ